MTQHQFNFLDPKLIMTTVIVLIMLVVGVMAVSQVTTVQEQQQIGSSYDGTFAVTDSSIAQNCDTAMTGLTNINVTQQLSDGTWVYVPTAEWSYSGTTVIVQPGGMN